jgi:AcrR family transcriptional regulator
MARQRDAQAQQELLSAATWSVLADKGLTGLTVRAVAERAGCTTGLVMHAFPDKRALLRHARDLLHRRTLAQADAAEHSADGSIEKLRAVLHQAATLTPAKQEEARVWTAFIAAALADPQLTALHNGYHQAFFTRVQRLIATGWPELPAQQRQQHAAAAVALVEGLNTLSALDPETYHPDLQRHAIDHALIALADQAAETSP